MRSKANIVEHDEKKNTKNFACLEKRSETKLISKFAFNNSISTKQK